MCDQLYGTTPLMLDYYSRKIGFLQRKSKYGTVVRSFRFNTSSFFLSLYIYISASLSVYMYIISASTSICITDRHKNTLVRRRYDQGITKCYIFLNVLYSIYIYIWLSLYISVRVSVDSSRSFKDKNVWLSFGLSQIVSSVASFISSSIFTS